MAKRAKAGRLVIMLEFFLLRALYRNLANTAESKNRPRTWGRLGVALWILGEVLALALVQPTGQGGTYVAALFFAAVGATVAFAIVAALPELPPADFPVASIHKSSIHKSSIHKSE